MKTIKAAECSTIKMVSGNEKKFSTVIHSDMVKEWVGFGWIELRKPTKEDCRKLPMVVE